MDCPSVATSGASSPPGVHKVAATLGNWTACCFVFFVFLYRHSCWLGGNGRRVQLQITSSPSTPLTYQGGERILLESWGTETFKNYPFLSPKSSKEVSVSHWVVFNCFIFQIQFDGDQVYCIWQRSESRKSSSRHVKCTTGVSWNHLCKP